MSSFRSLILAGWILSCFIRCGNAGPPESTPRREQQTGPTQSVELKEQPIWTLSEKEGESTGEVRRMAGFAIRPPKDFRFVKHDPMAQSYIWIGPVRADETYAMLFVIISDLPDAEAKSSPKQLFEDVLNGIKTPRTTWKSTAVEQGEINGHPFLRSSWSGAVAPTARKGLAGRTMHGVAYLGLFANRAVQIQYQDVAPDHAESLRLGDIAASTFRKSK